MLVKLMKHEFRATGRIALPLCGLMLALSVLAGFGLRRINGQEVSGWLDMVSMTVTIAYGLSVFAVGVAVFVMLMLHYKRSMLGDEGYLTMTLPASTHALLLSRLLTAFLWYLIVAVFAALSMLIAAALGGMELGELFRAAADAMRRIDAGAVRFLVCSMLGGLLGLVCITLLFYADFTMAQAFRRHRVLYEVIGVIVLLLVLRLIGALNVVAFLHMTHESAGIIGGADGPTAIYVTGSTFPIGLVELLLADVGLYFLTYFFLRKKLNLE